MSHWNCNGNVNLIQKGMQAYPQVAIWQVLESYRFVRRHFVVTMTRRHRSLTPVYISWSAAEQVSLHVIPLRLQQPINGVRRGLAASGFYKHLQPVGCRSMSGLRFTFQLNMI